MHVLASAVINCAGILHATLSTYDMLLHEQDQYTEPCWTFTVINLSVQLWTYQIKNPPLYLYAAPAVKCQAQPNKLSAQEDCPRNQSEGHNGISDGCSHKGPGYQCSLNKNIAYQCCQKNGQRHRQNALCERVCASILLSYIFHAGMGYKQLLAELFKSVCTSDPRSQCKT